MRVPRLIARLGVAAVATLMLTTSTGAGQMVGTADRVRPRVDVAALAGVQPWFLASRSGGRMSLLQQIDPDLLLGAHRKKDKVEVAGPKGTRVWSVSGLAEHDIPAAALRAYKHAARVMAASDPSCELPWTLLAGIGRVESDHGRYGGSVLAADGVSHPRILGVALNGAGPVAAIHDSDNGRLDGDTVWDRAVGPMQFIPTTWANAGRDGDGDGVATPNDIDDAALAAAAYLCGGSGSVRTDRGMRAAIYRYNQSDYYVALVMAFEHGYATGVFSIPSPPPPKPDKDRKDGDHKKKHGDKSTPKPGSGKQSPDKQSPDQQSPDKDPTAKPGDGSTQPSPGTSPKPSPTPKPDPSPSPTPSPTPSPSPTPTLVSLTGPLTAAGSGWTVNGTPLFLGSEAQLARRAAHDYDGDKATETNAQELAGLVGKQVALLVTKNDGTAVVYTINEQDYRYADGSYA